MFSFEGKSLTMAEIYGQFKSYENAIVAVLKRHKEVGKQFAKVPKQENAAINLLKMRLGEEVNMTSYSINRVMEKMNAISEDLTVLGAIKHKDK